MRLEYPIYEAKAKLSEILRAVKARREIVITERGRKIARVVAYERDEPESLEGRMAQLRDQGTLRSAEATPAEVFDQLRSNRQPGALQRFLQDRT